MPVPAAELARSILACPATVELVVDGLPRAGADRGLSLMDVDGTPTFGCLAGSLMARAGHEERKALVTMASGLGPAAGSDRRGRVALTGRLRTRAVDACACCSEVRHTVVLGLELVVVTPPHPVAPGAPVAPVVVELDAFRDPGLSLNRGNLQRCAEHANACHQDELRHAVARTTRLPVREIVGVGLSGLTPAAVDVAWVDRTGAHRFTRTFDPPAGTLAELGERLREELHAGIC